MSKKVSPKKQSRFNYKWAKILGWQIDDLKKEIETMKKEMEILKNRIGALEEN